MLDMNIELAEHKFLEETLIDDDENDDGITNDNDHEFGTTWGNWRDQVLVVPLATKEMEQMVVGAQYRIAGYFGGH